MTPHEPGPAAEQAWPGAEALSPNGDFLRQAERDSGVGIGACYGCKKCSNGCPLTFAMDLHPFQVVRLAQLGQVERLSRCRTIWVCSSCQTCLTRCPNQVDLPRFMDWLKERVAKGGGSVEQARTLLFHRLFLDEVKARGRVFEGSLMTRYLLKTGGAFGPEAMANARLGLAMFKRGRLKLLPAGIKQRRWLKDLFKA
ncbi:MAG: 4Fe-4S dicluster domain-containing protein [Desulfarculus sp.]|nr:4Fe-4S dicluster domain-containing protein [Desulfarculus sp.]